MSILISSKIYSMVLQNEFDRHFVCCRTSQDRSEIQVDLQDADSFHYFYRVTNHCSCL